jgi:hypothetical protein
MLSMKSTLCILTLSWISFGSPVSNESTTTSTPAASTTQGVAPKVLVVDDISSQAATPSIVNINGDTTIFKLLTVTAKSGRASGATFTPTITQAPSSYAVEHQIQTSISGAGQLTLKGRNDCSLTYKSSEPYLVSCSMQISAGGYIPSVVSGILSSEVSAVNRGLSTETIGPLATKTAIPQKTSDSFSFLYSLRNSAFQFILVPVIVSILTFLI